MDLFDERILASLKEGKSKDFTALRGEVGFSHNTLQQHLEQLTAKGLVTREKPALTGFGRPKFAYHVPSKTTRQVSVALKYPEVELVTIAFSRLRHICRFEKAAAAKKKGGSVRIKYASKSENKTHDHFAPIKGQNSARIEYERIFRLTMFRKP